VTSLEVRQRQWYRRGRRSLLAASEADQPASSLAVVAARRFVVLQSSAGPMSGSACQQRVMSETCVGREKLFLWFNQFLKTNGMRWKMDNELHEPTPTLN